MDVAAGRPRKGPGAAVAEDHRVPGYGWNRCGAGVRMVVERVRRYEQNKCPLYVVKKMLKRLF